MNEEQLLAASHLIITKNDQVSKFAVADALEERGKLLEAEQIRTEARVPADKMTFTVMGPSGTAFDVTVELSRLVQQAVRNAEFSVHRRSNLIFNAIKARVHRPKKPKKGKGGK